MAGPEPGSDRLTDHCSSDAAGELEGLRRALYSSPSQAATDAYLAACEQAAQREARDAQHDAAERARKRTHIRVVQLVSVGLLAGIGALSVVAVQAWQSAQLTAAVARAARDPLYPACGIVDPDQRLVERALQSSQKPSLNDLAWLRGSILSNTNALQTPDRAGERGVATGTQRLSLASLGRLSAGTWIRVSVVADRSAVTWAVVGAEDRSWGRCGSAQAGAAATAVLQLTGPGPYEILVRTAPSARFAYFSELPAYPQS